MVVILFTGTYLLNVTAIFSPMSGVVSRKSLAMAAKLAVVNSTRAQVVFRRGIFTRSTSPYSENRWNRKVVWFSS